MNASPPQSCLVHICCSVDSHYFLQELKKTLPNAELVGFFYNPNIHPYSEYYLRLLDVKRSCEMLDIKLIQGNYDYEKWFNEVRGYEKEPEKGKRCQICFDNRLEQTAIKAKELNINHITTTLLTSPKKSLQQLQAQGIHIQQKYEVEFLVFDFRKNGGTQKQFELAKEDNLYKQNYCGCIFALQQQRKQQNILCDELISPINNQTLQGSLEQKINFYEKRLENEKQQIPYKIIKNRFLNYRLLNAFVKVNNQVVPSHFLPYSTTTNKNIKTKVEFEANQIKFLSKENIQIISLEDYNNFMTTSFENTKQLMFHKIDYTKELSLKKELSQNNFDLNCIIVVDDYTYQSINNKKIEIYLDQITYSSTKESLIG
jgi:predicted adenine nucleotide alpha hydrolase (AANH) superfamily ATPase